MTIHSSLAILLLLPAAMALEVQAQTVNKWVDDEGVTHFSDQKPAGSDADVREIEIPKGSVSQFDAREVNERVNSVLQQLEQDRKAREAEAAARIRVREEEQALELEAVVEENKQKKKKKRNRPYYGPYPKPLPGPFPEQYPRQFGPAVPSNPIAPDTGNS
ncbi:MAG TPA: DUF4124 domain-containing protein [Gammaproteobacteria bacterium]